jgi:hypothetical protein
VVAVLRCGSLTMQAARKPALGVLLAMSVGVAAAADQPRKAFVDAWRGRRVEVKRTLYTLVYNERGRFGKVYHDKREGLLVVTPSAGSYLQFDGRDAEADISGRDPQQIVDRIGEVYRRSEALEIGFYLRIEPVLVSTYPPGGTLIVRDVAVERNRVRLTFASVAADAPAEQVATGLMIQWPTDFSANFTERPLVESLIGQVVGQGAQNSRAVTGIRN